MIAVLCAQSAAATATGATTKWCNFEPVLEKQQRGLIKDCQASTCLSQVCRHCSGDCSAVLFEQTFVSGLSCETYQSLRSEVQRLKSEHKQMSGARQVARQVKTRSLWDLISCGRMQCHHLSPNALQIQSLSALQLQNESELQEQAYLDKISKLQVALHDATERSGKLRQQYER